MGLVPGDRVIAQPLDDGRAIVDAREPRASGLVRKTRGGRRKTMAANVDTLAIVASFARPALDLRDASTKCSRSPKTSGCAA